MNIHQNARLTPSGREQLVRLARIGLSPKAVAETMGVCSKTVGKWGARFDAEGVVGLQDRSSRPHRLHRPTPAQTQDAILALRRQRLTGHHGMTTVPSGKAAPIAPKVTARFLKSPRAAGSWSW